MERCLLGVVIGAEFIECVAEILPSADVKGQKDRAGVEGVKECVAAQPN